MKYIKIEKYEDMDKIEKSEKEDEKGGIIISHENSDFKKMVFSISSKALTHPGEITDIPRPSSLCTSKSQIHSVCDMFSTLYIYIKELSETKNCIEQMKILTSGILANLFSEILNQNEKSCIVPLLGETLIVY